MSSLTSSPLSSQSAPALASRLAALCPPREPGSGVLLLDPQGIVVGAGGGSDVVLGHRVDELLGRPVAELYTPEDRSAGLDEHEREVARAQGSSADDRWHLHADGGRIWAEGLLLALKDAQGRCLGFAKRLRERHDLRAQIDGLQQQVQGLQARNEALTHALGQVIHDLANPLAPLTTAVRMLATGGGEKLPELLPVLERQVGQMRQLLDTLRSTQQAAEARDRLQPERLELRPLLQALEQVAQPQLQARRQRLKLLLPAVPLWVEADAQRLHELLWHLVDNAMQYSPTQATLWVWAGVEAESLLLRVRDPGLGFDAPRQQALQQALNAADDGDAVAGQALGVGLSRARRLVQLHGGSIQLHSAGPGEGCEASVRLPLRQPRP